MDLHDPSHVLSESLRRQLAFILEVDRLKEVVRRSYLLSETRRENTAEHSWHVALMATVLKEHAEETVDADRVVRMLLVHDIVEVDAGDTFAYDDVAGADKAQREARAAQRLFGLLPGEQADEFRALWEEFEARKTPEARFAAALDRLMPLLHNFYTNGRSWQEHGVEAAQVRKRNAATHEGSEKLWQYGETLIAEAVTRGWLKP